TTKVANATGVQIAGRAKSNRVGTDGSNDPFNAAERNVISGNTTGVLVANAGTDNTVIAGNYVGLNAAGTAALGNTGNGVSVGNSNSNRPQFTRVGTNGDGVADDLERNVISGNGGSGVRVEGTATAQTVIAGNYIGTDATGAVAVGNAADGVFIVGAQG